MRKKTYILVIEQVERSSGHGQSQHKDVARSYASKLKVEIDALALIIDGVSEPFSTFAGNGPTIVFHRSIAASC